ncbi:MAG TPA: M48 family metallopeptidase [Dehalococcoidia bacterium]|nr:M48 family metallopeptidase [Dehalococcoidia bacterium]
MWEQIRANRTRSIILVTVMAVMLLAIGYFLGFYIFENGLAGLFIALVIWFIMTLIAFYSGDNILLSLARAKKIGPNDYPRLYNVVEEMKIASGLEKMPDVYIIDDKAMNAFATGRDPSKASVAITTGLLEKLNRDELQGVIGHELAHIKNRDVLLMAITAVMLGTIVILAWYVSRLLIFGSMGRSRSSARGGGGQAQLIILIVGIVFMILAPILAQLIYYAISRKREYLADASSALYTRYPEGLASALEKISGSTVELKTANKATAPMYIINPFRTKGMSLSNATSTHPPVAERIRILRSMAGGASFAEYDRAYRQVHPGGRSVISQATQYTAGAVGLREASPEEKKSTREEISRKREVEDVMLKLNDYRIVQCSCGTRWKIPPNFPDPEVLCTKCGGRVKVR